MINQAIIDQLRLLHAEMKVERIRATHGRRMQKAEAFSLALFEQRDLVMKGLDALDDVRALRASLKPFARAACLVPPGQNAVLVSIGCPSDAGRTFVQFRGSDFALAAMMLWDQDEQPIGGDNGARH